MNRRKQGFTLVELLVVIGIIALLISILLPSLNKARRAANTLKCEANLHSICQAMLIYAAQNSNYILGSPNTTGGGLYATTPPPGQSATITTGSCPGINQIWDWESPVCDILGVKFKYTNPGGDPQHRLGQARWDRVKFESSYPLFQCPQSTSVAVMYSNQGSADFPGATGLPVVFSRPSYSTSIAFLVLHDDSGAGTLKYTGATYMNPPAGYSPKVNKVGDPSRKIFIAEGARYIRTSQNENDVDYSVAPTQGGEYSDTGAGDRFSYGRNRECAPGNGDTTTADERAIWAPHGELIPHGPADSYKFTAGFFDGHCEVLGDLQGSNPQFWAPKGTAIGFNSSPSELLTDVCNRYLGGSTDGFYLNN